MGLTSVFLWKTTLLPDVIRILAKIYKSSLTLLLKIWMVNYRWNLSDHALEESNALPNMKHAIWNQRVSISSMISQRNQSIYKAQTYNFNLENFHASIRGIQPSIRFISCKIQFEGSHPNIDGPEESSTFKKYESKSKIGMLAQLVPTSKMVCCYYGGTQSYKQHKH